MKVEKLNNNTIQLKIGKESKIISYKSTETSYVNIDSFVVKKDKAYLFVNGKVSIVTFDKLGISNTKWV